MAELWERQPNESDTAYNAFQAYLTMSERNCAKVAEKLRRSASLIRRWAKLNRWRDRADAWDSEISRKAMEKAQEDFAAMIERQINISRMFQARAANAIQNMELSNLPPKFLSALVEMAKVGMKMERSARELKKDKPQENIFVSTLEKIWQEHGDDD